MNKNRYSAKIRFDKLSADSRDCSQIFSCAYMKYTLLVNAQLQDCYNSEVSVYQQERNYALQYKDSHYPQKNKLEFRIHCF